MLSPGLRIRFDNKIAKESQEWFYEDGLKDYLYQAVEEFEKAVKLINSSGGHIVICGMGKSGLVGRKISATLDLLTSDFFTPCKKFITLFMP